MDDFSPWSRRSSSAGRRIVVVGSDSYTASSAQRASGWWSASQGMDVVKNKCLLNLWSAFLSLSPFPFPFWVWMLPGRWSDVPLCWVPASTAPSVGTPIHSVIGFAEGKCSQNSEQEYSQACKQTKLAYCTYLHRNIDHNMFFPALIHYFDSLFASPLSILSWSKIIHHSNPD